MEAPQEPKTARVPGRGHVGTKEGPCLIPKPGGWLWGGPQEC